MGSREAPGPRCLLLLDWYGDSLPGSTRLVPNHPPSLLSVSRVLSSELAWLNRMARFRAWPRSTLMRRGARSDTVTLTCLRFLDVCP